MNEKEYHDLLANRFRQCLNKGMEKSIKRQVYHAVGGFCPYVSDKNVRILDAGCHEGIALRRLKHFGYTKAEGVEYLQVLVRATQRKGCKAQEGDVHNLHMFDSNIFGAIFSRYLLEHCHTASKAIQELSRILKPNGIMYIVVSSEMNGAQTRQGSTVFKTIEDFGAIIPDGMETVSLKTKKTFMGWYDIIYVGRKKQ